MTICQLSKERINTSTEDIHISIYRDVCLLAAGPALSQRWASVPRGLGAARILDLSLMIAYA